MSILTSRRIRMTLRSENRNSAALAGLIATLPLLAAACSKPASLPAEEATAKAGAARDAPSKTRVVPYEYPAPVKGHYAEINTGEFDLVDGLAWTTPAGGRVVFVTSKAIASPRLAPACPALEAQSLTILRDAGWVEVNFDAAGKSTSFGGGTPLGGKSREQEVGGRYWKADLRDLGSGRIAGSVNYRGRGSFEFDLPLVAGGADDMSESQKMDGGMHRPSAAVPPGEAIERVYEALRTAARAGDLAAFLEAQGFDAERSAAIRGLAGIEEDWKRLADRFLEPGTIESLEPQGGGGAIGARGKNSAGAEFYNYYHLVSCGDRLLLGAIGENPQ
jgi:hypothetical protein